MAAEEQESKRGFRVQDRRRFSPETGEPRGEEVEQSPSEEIQQRNQPENKADTHKTQNVYDQSNEPISFSSFVLGLITQALLFMGEAPPPPGQMKQIDLSAARQMIDLLAMLKQKTKGNLDSTEDTMLENALFDLRMRYVQIAKKQ
ncbi:MAG: DUF1844 domain-containing protein [Candidatus Binatia bacterium]